QTQRSANRSGRGEHSECGSCWLQLCHGSHPAELEKLLGVAGGEHVHDPGDDPAPSGLMARAETRAVVAVEVLVEQEEVPPVRVVLESPCASVHRSPAVGAAEEDAAQATADVLGHLVERQPPSPAAAPLART